MSELRFVDLSVPIQEPVEGELKGGIGAALAARIDYQDHRASAQVAAEILGCTVADLPGGLGWGNEAVELSTHAGTHVDAPWHYFPTCGGRPARRVHELELGHFFGDGVVLDLTRFGPGERVQATAVQEAVDATGEPLAAGDIVLLRFDADKTFGTPEYWTSYPGLSGEATRWLIEQGVKTIGTDAVGFDRDFGSIARDFAADGDASKLWEAHRIGAELEYFQIEKLANLDQLPSRGFKVACFPVKVRDASAAWTRAVGIVGL